MKIKFSEQLALLTTWALVMMTLATPEVLARNNRVSGHLLGIVMCTVQEDVFEISGSTDGSNTPVNGWHVTNNEAFGNGWGYLLVDGANHNFLANNAAWNNMMYDIELAGDSMRFGFFSPTSHDNVLVQGSQKDLVVKDCGLNNTVSSDITLVDTSEDPCF